METKSLVLTEEDIRRGLKATPEQRLNWLEEANGFIRKVRVLRGNRFETRGDA